MCDSVSVSIRAWISSLEQLAHLSRQGGARRMSGSGWVGDPFPERMDEF